MYKSFILALIVVFAIACNPSKKVQKYEYLTENTTHKPRPTPEPESTPTPPPAPKPEPKPKPSPAPSSTKQKVIKKALSFQGTPYRYGGTT